MERTMKIYVANTTKQIQEIHYRVPENPRPMVQSVKCGEQIRLFKDDATAAEVGSIVEQLDRYGAIRVDAIDRTKDFNGLCYSIDKPVKPEAMVRVVQHNDDVLEQRGAEMRKQAAVAVAESAGISERRYGLDEMEVSIKEEAREGDDPDDKMGHVISVTRDAAPPRKARGKRN